MTESPYRKQRGRPADPYLAVWAEFARKRRSVWIVFFAWPFVGALGVWLLSVVTGGATREVAPFVLIPTIVLTAIIMEGTRFICPRCEKPFYSKGQYGNPFSRRCLNCGIRIGTPKETTVE